MTTLQQLRAQAVVEAETALQRYERARGFAASGQSTSWHRVPDELQRLRDLFEAGQADVLNVFAAQTGLLQERRSYLDLLNELAQAAADVTLYASVPPARLITVRSRDSSHLELLPIPEARPISED